MAKLLIKCPVTGKALFTGMDLPKGMDLSGFTNNSTQCHHCGKMHVWNGSDAFFDEA